jgi:preprotein translocase subunit SecG
METVLRVFQVFLAIALIGVVLLQRSEGGGLGIGSSGGMGSFMSVRGTANLLTRVTAVLAALFMTTCLALALVANPRQAPRSIFDNPASAPTIPAPQAPAPAAPASGQLPSNVPAETGSTPAPAPLQAPSALQPQPAPIAPTVPLAPTPAPALPTPQAVEPPAQPKPEATAPKAAQPVGSKKQTGGTQAPHGQ